MRVLLLLDIRNLIQHSSRAAYDGGHSPENLLEPFFFFQLVFYSSFRLNHCMVPRDLAFRVWEKLSTTSGILVSVWVFIPYYYYHYCSFLLRLVHMVSFHLEQSTNFGWRRTGLEAQMIWWHTDKHRRLLHFAGIFHTHGNWAENSVALYDNSQELNDEAKARIAGVNSGVMLWVITRVWGSECDVIAQY